MIPDAGRSGVSRATVPPAAPLSRVLWLIPLIYALLVTGEFLALTQVALGLTARGASALSVGVLASAFWLGILLASLGAARLVMRFGHDRCFIAAMLVSTLAFGSLVPHDRYLGWLAGVAVMGGAGGVLWVTGEAWLAEAAPPARRGFFVGLFETAVGVGLVGGPALLPLVEAAGGAPRAVAFGLTVAAALAAAIGLRGQGPVATPQLPGAEGQGPAAARRAALPLVAVATMAGILEAGSAALLPSIALRLGGSAAVAAALGAVIGAGSALLPTPSGLLADRIGLRRVLGIAWGLLVAATALLLAGALIAGARGGAGAAPLLWPAGFVLGGMGAAVYTLAVIDFGHRFSGPGLLRAMALLVTGYTAGTSLGPVLGGALFDAGGLVALAGGLLLSSLAGAVLARHLPAG